MKQLTALDPNVRAIVSSGYSSDSVMANFTDFGFRAAVKKPYQMRKMSLVLNEVIKSWLPYIFKPKMLIDTGNGE